MNLFNRLLVILATLVLIIISVTICLQVLNIISIERIGISFPLVELLLPNYGSDLATRLAAGGSSLGVFSISLVLLFFELRQFFSKERYFLVAKESLGMIEVSELCIKKFINYEAKQLVSIGESRSTIKETSDGFYIKTFVTITPETSITELGKDLQLRIKTAMQEKLGLYVSEVDVKTRLISPQNETTHFKNRSGQRTLD